MASWILPTDVCHPLSIFPNCTRAHVARIGFRICTRSIRGTRRFTPTSPLRRDRSLFRQVLRLPIAWRSSPLTSPSQPSFARPGLSTERVRAADRRGHFCLRRRDAPSAIVTRDAFGRSLFERLPPRGVSRFLRRRPVSNLGGLEGYAFSIHPKVSVRLCRLALTLRCARGVPTRLAPARVDAVPVRG